MSNSHYFIEKYITMRDILQVLEIAYSAEALEALTRLPRSHRAGMVRKIVTFAVDPSGRHPFARSLKGRPGQVRVRQGDWRAIIAVDHDAGRLTVLFVRHRREGI